MGNDQTTLRHKDLNKLQMTRYLQISAQHNKKLIHKNLKPFKQFQSIINSIQKRSSYLKYQWALQLCQELTKNPQKLYQQYCDSFRLGVVRQSRYLKCFQPKCLSQNFFSSFQKSANELQTNNFTNQDLQNQFQEVKCYFMVLNWFLELPVNNFTQNYKATLNYRQSSKQNINLEKSSQFSSSKKQHFTEIDCQRQKIYGILLKLTQRYFDNYYFEKELKPQLKQIQSPKLNPIKRFSLNQANLIKLIARESSFRQRQIYIGSLVDLLFQKYQNTIQKHQLSSIEKNKLKALVQILGMKKVYCVLRIITEVGQIQQIQQISIILNFILQNIILPKKQKVNQSIYLKVRKSPQKKQKSNKNIRTQSIR